MCGTLTKRTSRRDVRENSFRITKRNNEAYLVETARSVAHLAEQAGRPEDGSSREKAEAPAEVAAGAASVEVAADAESHKNAPAEVAGAAPVEVAADADQEMAPGSVSG